MLLRNAFRLTCFFPNTFILEKGVSSNLSVVFLSTDPKDNVDPREHLMSEFHNSPTIMTLGSQDQVSGVVSPYHN